MIDYKSLLDPDHNINVSNDCWVVAILHKPNSANPEETFLMMEGINSFDKLVLRRYDFKPDLKKENTFKIGIEERVVDVKDGIGVYLNILNNENANGRCWMISIEDAKKLHQNILNSQEKQGVYNPLGSYALAPICSDMARSIPPSAQKIIKTGAISGTGLIAGPEAAGAAAIGTEVVDGLTYAVKKMPSSIKEPLTKPMFSFMKNKLGQTTSDIAQNSFKPSGHNSFTWARSMLQALNDEVISRELPRRPFDILKSVTSRHLKDLKTKEHHKWISRNK